MSKAMLHAAGTNQLLSLQDSPTPKSAFKLKISKFPRSSSDDEVETRTRSATIDSPRALSPRDDVPIGPIIPNRAPRTPKSQHTDDAPSSQPVSRTIEGGGADSPVSPRLQRTATISGTQVPANTSNEKPKKSGGKSPTRRSPNRNAAKRATVHLANSSSASSGLDMNKIRLHLAQIDQPTDDFDAVDPSTRKGSLSARGISSSNAAAALILMNPRGVIFESQLYKLNSAHKWKKRWVVLTNEHLIVYKNRTKDPSTATVIPMAHSTAREAAASSSSGEPQSAKAFDVFASDGTNHSFSGDSDVEAKVWLGMIKEVTDSLLTEAMIHSARESKSALGTLPPQLLDMIVNEPENTKCADCCCPDPDWASITFGTFICITCSGIHRSVGTALCSVRSVMYDNWDDTQISAMRGNKIANEFWESCIPDGSHKPHALSTEEEKNSWFVRKYFKREFVDPVKAPELKRMVYTGTTGRFRVWKDRANELLESIYQLQQHYPHVTANLVTPNLLLARRNSVSDFSNRPGAPSSSSPVVITTSIGKKAKQLKKDKRERSVSKLAPREPQTPSMPSSPSSSHNNTSMHSTPVQAVATNLQARELDASKRYASSPTLLKEALLFLISEDEHFKRQLRLILREPAQPASTHQTE